MLFYEELVKKIDGNIELSGQHKFLLDLPKTAMWLGTGIPFFIIGLLEIYIGTGNGIVAKDLILGMVFLFMGLRHIKMYLSYKVVLDFTEDKLISKELNLDFKKIYSCTLKEDVIGKKKKVRVILEVITKDKEQIFIPIIMNKQVKFLNLFKGRLGDKFKIIK